MKKNTLLKRVLNNFLFLSAFLFVCQVSAQSFVLDLQSNPLNFTNANRTLITNAGTTASGIPGTAAGSVHRYDNLIFQDGINLSAFLTILQVNNANITLFDDDATTSSRFQPRIGSANGAGGFVLYRLDYFDSATNLPVFIFDYFITAVDIDGTSAANREFAEFGGFTSYTVNNPTQLVVSSDPTTGRTRFLGRTTSLAGVTFDNTASVIANYTEPSNTITFVLGQTGANTERQYSVQLGASGGLFTNPITNPNPFPIANDDFGASLGSTTGGVSVTNVLDNDIFNAAPVVPSDVTLTLVTPASDPGVVLNLSNGEVTVAPGTPPGIYTLTYRICLVSTPANCDDAVVTVEVVEDPDLSISKTIDNPSPVIGTNIFFTLTATNNGLFDAMGVNVTDNLPAGYTLVNATPSIGSFAAGIWTIGNLTNGQSATLTIEATVNATGPYDNTATISGNEPDPDLSNNSDTATATPTAGIPSLDLQKTASVGGPGTVGDVVTYFFTVTNTGDVTLNNVVVTDLLPGLSAISGSPVASLAPGANAVLTATYTITQADVNAGRVSNTATATSDEGATDVSDGDGPTTDGDGDTDPTNDPTVVPLTQNPAIDLVKTASVGGTGAVNDVISYSFTVTNTGDVTLTSVVVDDALTASVALAVSPSTLAPGQTGTATATYTILQSDVNNGSVTNTATATGKDPQNNDVSDVSDDDNGLSDGPDPDSDPTNDPTTVPLTQNPSIALIKTGVRFDDNDDSAAAKDEVIEYTFTVSNTGNIALINVELNDPLLGGLISGPESGDLNGDSILDVGEIWIYRVQYTLTQADVDAGQLINQATVEALSINQGLPVSDLSDDNSNTEDDPTIIPLPQLPSIGLIKTATFNDEDSDGFAQVGETISYVFTVKNTGTVTLTNITIQDPLVSVQGGPLASLAPGQTNATTFTATYAITQADIILGFFVNQATVFGEDPNLVVVSDLSDDQTVLKDNPTVTPLARKELFALIKTGAFRENDGDGISEAGEFIDYTFTVTNLGDIAIENIVVTDPLLGGVVSGPSSGDTNSNAILDVNEVWVFNATYTITQFDIDEAGVINQAILTGKTLGGTDLQDLSDDNSNLEDDPTVTPLVIGNQIELTKIGVFNDDNNNGLADAGESITYFFTVSNTGSQTVFGITVTDPLVSVSGNPINLDPGESNGTEFSATYIITQDDINLGSVTNQAFTIGRIDDGSSVDDISDNPNDLTDNDLDGDGEPDDPTVTALPQFPSITITKTGVFADENGDGFSQVGETIRYTFTVTNTGNVDLFEVSITDPIVSVSGGILPSLTVGTSDSSTFTAIYVLTQNDIENGEVVNQATVNAMTIDSETISDLSDDPTTPIENDPTIVPLLGDLIIYNGISDNGDGSNDSFTIKGIERFPDNLVEIYNRWGVKVFDTKGYGSPGGKVFTGISDGRSTINKNEKLPEGTYFYVLKYKDGNNQNREKAGYLYINR